MDNLCDWKFQERPERYQHQIEKIKALNTVIKELKLTGTVPSEYRPHPLSGNWAGYIECHVQSDLLLIWFNADAHEIRLVRFGTHSELFKK